VYFVNIEGVYLSKFRYTGFWRCADLYTVDSWLCPRKLKVSSLPKRKSRILHFWNRNTFSFPWDRDHHIPLLHLTIGKEQIQHDDDTLNGKTSAFL